MSVTCRVRCASARKSADTIVRRFTLNGEADLELFGRLIGLWRLGFGECAAIVAAICGGHALAIDDRKSAREAHRGRVELTILGAADLVVMMIWEGLLTLADTDAMKAD